MYYISTWYIHYISFTQNFQSRTISTILDKISIFRSEIGRAIFMTFGEP